MRLHTKDFLNIKLSLLKEIMGLNNKVDFVVAGAQKSGTNALNDLLKLHPQLCFTKKKKRNELHFFDDDRLFTGWINSNHKYHMHFSPRQSHQLIGDVTPAYMYHPNAAERMSKYNPKLKIIVILRNPIERAFSHWNMQTKRKRESRPFLEAIKCELVTPHKTFPHRSKRFSFENRYLARGLYTEQIMRLHFFFPKKQVYILKNEDLRLNPDKTLEDIFDFLSIDPSTYNQIQQKKDTFSRYITTMSKEEWGFLRNYYENEIPKLSKYTGLSFNSWLDTPSFK